MAVELTFDTKTFDRHLVKNKIDELIAKLTTLGNGTDEPCWYDEPDIGISFNNRAIRSHLNAQIDKMPEEVLEEFDALFDVSEPGIDGELRPGTETAGGKGKTVEDESSII